MAKKRKRDMTAAGASQHKAEATHADKFASAAELIQPKPKVPAKGGRISPQLSCSVGAEDMEFLKNLTLELSVREGRVLKLSQTVRALIDLGRKHKEKLTVIE